MRIYLAGDLWALDGESRLAGASLPGRQGVLALTYLILERRQAARADELAEALWPGEIPAAWDIGLRALLSKCRAAIAAAGLGGSMRIERTGGYRITLPPETWVDVEAAGAAIHEAEAALERGDARAAAGPAIGVRAIAERGFLPGFEGMWVEEQRARLEEIRVRAVAALAETWLAHDDPALALRDARELVRLQPYNEAATRLEMRARVTLGDHGAAALSFRALQQRLREDLGVDPAPATVAAFQALKRT